jgi:outer membrane receptor protein involved in Fe transport
MHVSRTKKISPSFYRTPISAGVLVALTSPALMAQESERLEEVVVTAQKRSENLQDVPISIQALGNEQIEELNLQNFKDYATMLPSVAMTPNLGSGLSQVYMRGIATAGDGQATTSLPSVGMYLDELSITTIQGNLDVHLYDVARVEALAGPQGTLYGASSQAGTIRVITNKPQLGEFSSSVSAEANSVSKGGTGYTLEGFVNAPIGDNAAIRLVGWSRSDAGWIDNVLGSRTYPGNEDMAEFETDDPDTPEDEGLIPNATWCGSTTDCSLDDITLTNTDKVEDDYNTIDTIGARAALRVDLNEDWTITPSLMYQKSEQEGSWGDDLSDFVPGDYAVSHIKDEFTNDEWTMVGLTIEGSIGDFDVVYAGSYLDRQVDGSYDYADYSYWYDVYYTSGYYADLHFSATGDRPYANRFVPEYFDAVDVGTRMMSGARFTNDDGYTKENHEVRISTNPDNRVRGMLGYFWQHQFHDFEQHWIVDGGLAPIMEMNEGMDPRFDDTVYLNSMYRNDRDQAIFASVSFDITDDVELTVGTRFFEPTVSVKGFFGFGLGFTPMWSSNGENRCNLVEGDDGWTADFNGQADWFNKPCLNVDKGLKESDNVSRVNVNWTVNDDSMLYFTWSEGYRPGGVQRNPSAGEYLSDFLTNIEFGWKSQWMDNRFQLNGAVFKEEWKDFQVSFTGENAITAVNNGPTAEVLGLEAEMVWLPTDGLKISAAVALYDTELKDDYCNFTAGVCTKVLAPAGTRLPVTADFKGNIVARYNFPIGSFDGYVQGALAHEGERSSDMDQSDNDIRGDVPAYTTLDLSAGVRKNSYAVDLFIKNATGEDAPLYLTGQCTPATCGAQNYGVRVRPLTVGLKFTKDWD